jgi:hypothetical protein
VPRAADIRPVELDPDSAVVGDHCSPNPCLNGGTCADRGTSFTCSCVPPWSGFRCGNATFIVNASARGTYASTTWYPPASGISIAGHCCGGNEVRPYFVFPIPSFTGSVRFVLLHLEHEKYESPDESETLVVYDVSTPVTTLAAHPKPWDAVFADLGGGTQLGTFDVSAGTVGATVPVLLPRAAGAVSRARGSSLAIGVSLGTASGGSNENVTFGATTEARRPRLEIRVTMP